MHSTRQSPIATLERVKENATDWVGFEADRCLNCFDPPCQKACPASIPVPLFIGSVRSGDLLRAARLIRDANPMAATCGAICPEDVFCQIACTRGKIDAPLKIKELHSYATRFEETPSPNFGRKEGKVAIIGAGPAGLACATRLALNGVDVIVFDRSDHAGGVPSHSIPGFRLPEEIVSKDVEYARSLGVEFVFNSPVDEPASLLGQSDAVFVAAGLSVNKRLGIPGEDSPGVKTALPFLEEARAGRLESLTGRKVVVVGGGNVSLDVASTVAHLRADEVRLLYRRGPQEMKVWSSELHEAQSRGVIIDYQAAPVEFVTQSGKLEAVKCLRTRLSGSKDADGRRRPNPISGTEFDIPADLAIVAVGLTSNYGRGIKVKPDLTTSMAGIFAGGDWARGEGTIVEAVGDGKLAAVSILSFLKEKNR